MPYVIIKLYPGRSERQKAQLAEAIVKDMVAIAKVGDDAVSVALKKSNRIIGPTRSIRGTFLTPPGSYTRNQDITDWNSAPIDEQDNE
jgi:hypothetical protein